MSNNRQIAKNTLFLYLRMFVMMAVSLYTSRIVLKVLGEEDYGIYNIVGGVVVLFSFLNTALLQATQRYLNFYIGKNDDERTSKIFCMSLNTYFVLSFILLILAETLGIWFVNAQLNIPQNRIGAANWVYQFSILTFIVNLLRVPYNAIIIAYERMNFYAYVSIFEALAKLAVVYLIIISPFDKLIFYSFLYMMVPLVNNFIYFIYTKRKFLTARYKLMWDTETFRTLFSFSSWSLLGSLANLTASQGINILLNIFYGVTVNAASGIANSVINTLYGFISNFQTAFNPQIVKTYAQKDFDQFYDLIFKASKFSFYLFLVLALPVMFTTQQLLEIWLEIVPKYTSIFCQLTLVFLCIEAISAPLWMSVQATGKIREYQILIASCILLNFPLAYLVLKLGTPVYYVLIIRILINLFVFAVRCLYMEKKIKFPLKSYFKEVIFPVLCVTLTALLLPFIASLYLDSFWLRLIFLSVFSIISALSSILLIGINRSEKKVIYTFIKSKFFNR